MPNAGSGPPMNDGFVMRDYASGSAGTYSKFNIIEDMGNGQAAPNLYCAVIVKRVDEQTRSKTGINELLRD